MMDNNDTGAVPESVMNRILKLLTTAEGTANDNEAQVALVKAQELMLRWHLDAAALSAAKPMPGMDVPADIITVARSVNKILWHGQLGNLIADNFRCVCYWTGDTARFRRADGTRYDQKIIMLNYIGLPGDLEIASKTYYAAKNAVEHLSEAYMKENPGLGRGETRQIRTDYIFGFIAGLKKHFDEAKAAMPGAMALMIVKPEAVMQRGIQLGLAVSRRTVKVHVDAGSKAHREGFARGKTFQNVKRLGPAK